MARKKTKRRHRKIRLKSAAWAALLLLALGSLVLFCESRLSLVSEHLVYDGAARLFERSVGESLEELSGEYTFFESSRENGNVTDLRILPEQVNAFKTALLERLTRRLSGSETLWIPVGNFTDLAFLNGAGFSVPVNIHYTGSAEADFQDEIASAGVNQSKFSLYLEVHATLHTHSVRYPEGEIPLSTRVLLAQTVLVGEAPGLLYSRSGE